MISYEIIHINRVLLSMQVKYSLEGKNDYFTRMAFELPITEDNLHELARRNAVQAEAYWAREAEVQEFELTEATGTAKRTSNGEVPEFDQGTQKLVPSVVEDETSIVYGWEVVPLTSDEKVAAVREKRNALLLATDTFAVRDRPVSDEMMAYRQALREIPQQETFPDNITWPVMPVD